MPVTTPLERENRQVAIVPEGAIELGVSDGVAEDLDPFDLGDEFPVVDLALVFVEHRDAVVDHQLDDPVRVGAPAYLAFVHETIQGCGKENSSRHNPTTLSRRTTTKNLPPSRFGQAMV
ncbi:hypothetical protein [Kaistia sp. MMO-174]|uniref:hypothetical protein n=1 Tax=Kaistia sp. MMO-174 TaxID=3081256 RepID=UPI001ACD6410|nr:hypothetical protein [Hyphomicrobiales bacterium]